MEAGGVATAAFQSATPPGFFMIRGVSDFADKKKDSAKVQQWRKYACEIAATYTIALLQGGPVPLNTNINTNINIQERSVNLYHKLVDLSRQQDPSEKLEKIKTTLDDLSFIQRALLEAKNVHDEFQTLEHQIQKEDLIKNIKDPDSSITIIKKDIKLLIQYIKRTIRTRQIRCGFNDNGDRLNVQQHMTVAIENGILRVPEFSQDLSTNLQEFNSWHDTFQKFFTENQYTDQVGTSVQLEELSNIIQSTLSNADNLIKFIAPMLSDFITELRKFL